MSSISKRDDGLYWPETDVDACYEWTNAELYTVDIVAESCRQHRSIIHAGANVGAYTLKFANSFERVYAFEPDRTNFRCLSANTVDAENVHLFQAALGNNDKPVSLDNDNPANCGTFAVARSGTIPMLMIDSLNLDDVDCIHLDSEGYEFFILQAAINTIQKSSPLIVVEWLDHGEKYGWNREDLIEFIVGLGYHNMRQIGSDMMFRK